MNFNFLDVPKYYFVIDSRTPKQMNGLTLSNFRKIDVQQALESAILNNDLEIAIQWCIELHISGLTELFWDTIFHCSCRLINIMNPNLYLWIWNRFQKYRRILWAVQTKYHSELRNNQEMRNLLIEIISIVTLSKKNKLLLHPPPIYETDFHQQTIKDHSVAEDYQEINKFVNREEDSPEVIVAANEILNVLKFNMNTSAIYWYYWLEKLEQLKRKNSQNLKCFSRKISQVKETHWTDWVWIIWNILLENCQRFGHVEKHIKTLYQMYKHNFNVSSRRQKDVILCTAILFLKYDMNGQLDWKTPVIRHYHFYLQALGNVNTLYQTIFNNMSEHVGDSDITYMELTKRNMASADLKKYWNKWKKDLSKDGQESNVKGSLLTNMVAYKDKEKTNQSLSTELKSMRKAELIPDISYNLIKKNKKELIPPEPEPIKEKNILEYYQHPTAKVLPAIQTFSSNISSKELAKYEKEKLRNIEPNENMLNLDEELEEDEDKTAKTINTTAKGGKGKKYGKKGVEAEDKIDEDKILISQLNFVPRKKFEHNGTQNLTSKEEEFKEILI